MAMFRAVGGLGNQLFILVAAQAYSNHWGIPVTLDQGLAAKGAIGGGPHRIQSSLSSLMLNGERIKDSSSLRKIGRVFDLAASGERKLQRILSPGAQGSSFWAHTSVNPGFDPAVFSKRAAYFRGYFQSYRYLDWLRGNDFAFELSLRSPSAQFFRLNEALTSQPTLVMHVRRGDYTAHASSLGLLSASYYAKALELAVDRLGPLSVSVFSDDQSILSKPDFLPLAKRFKLGFVDTTNIDPAEALMLMSKGSAHIIANSSFGWFGAALGSPSLVIAPKPWFRGEDEPAGLITPDWTLLDAEWEQG